MVSDDVPCLRSVDGILVRRPSPRLAAGELTQLQRCRSTQTWLWLIGRATSPRSPGSAPRPLSTRTLNPQHLASGTTLHQDRLVDHQGSTAPCIMIDDCASSRDAFRYYATLAETATWLLSADEAIRMASRSATVRSPATRSQRPLIKERDHHPGDRLLRAIQHPARTPRRSGPPECATQQALAPR
jgi:hypothetical protein